MIDLYCGNTGNSVRALVALEECGLAYRRELVDLPSGAHNRDDYRRLNPFGLVPTMVDHEGPAGRPLVLSQSGAIMLYAGEKSGRLVPADREMRVAMLQWCFMATSDASPASAIMMYMDKNVADLTAASRLYLEKRFLRLMAAVEQHLREGEREYLLGDLSLADLALFPVVRMRRALLESRGDYTWLLRWADRIGARPAVTRATTF